MGAGVVTRALRMRWRSAALAAGSGLTRTERLAVAALARHLNDASGSCWPSLEALADAMDGLHVRHVRRALRSLEAKGWLAISEGRGRGRTSVYYPRVPGTTKPDTPAPFSELKPDISDTENRTFPAPKRGRIRPPEPEVRTREAEPECSGANAQRLVGFYVDAYRAVDPDGRPPPPELVKQLAGVLKRQIAAGHDEATLERALRLMFEQRKTGPGLL